MKYTIEGFDQVKMVDMGLNANHAIILRWFVDFYDTEKMATRKDQFGKEYNWVKYQKVIDDLPILGVKNREVVARYFKQLSDVGVLELYISKSKEGTYSCFRKGPKYSSLLERIWVTA